MTAALVLPAAATVFAAAAPTYGMPPMEDPLGVGASFALGTTTLIILGVAVGLTVRTARGAQAIGLLAFFPMFLLSGGGPPPDAMSDIMRRVADVLPLTHVVTSIREAWLGTASVGGHLLALSAWLVVGLAAVAWQVQRQT